ncbi:MAG: hypothetical protein ACLR0V_07440 [Roseburia hominis]
MSCSKHGENNKLFVVGELGRQYFCEEGLMVDAAVQVYRTEPDACTVRVSSRDHV